MMSHESLPKLHECRHKTSSTCTQLFIKVPHNIQHKQGEPCFPIRINFIVSVVVVVVDQNKQIRTNTPSLVVCQKETESRGINSTYLLNPSPNKLLHSTTWLFLMHFLFGPNNINKIRKEKTPLSSSAPKVCAFSNSTLYTKLHQRKSNRKA